MPLRKHLGAIALPLILTSIPCYASSDTDWSAIAQQDVKFAIETVRKSHAGAVAGQLDVTAPLETGARSALLEAAEARTENDYRRTLTRFISGFGDPHTSIGLGVKIQAWTGIVIDRVNGDYRVIWSEPDWPQAVPPLHAKVQSCDNVWIGTYLKTNVAPFSTRSLEYSVASNFHARQVMFDSGLDWTPKQCTFILPDGTAKSYDLLARPIEGGVGEARLKEVQKQYAVNARPAGIERHGADLHWVGMPNFDGAKSGAAYEKVYAELATIKQGWVVFDLRNNGGGDSSWGRRALNALYGTEYGDLLAATPTYGKSLIADKATVEQFEGYLRKPEYAASRETLEKSLASVEEAMRKGEKMAALTYGAHVDAANLLQRVRQHPGKVRVAAVINRGCFSSCMTFLQQIQAIGDAVVLGESTGGYSPYGEVNRFDLPSGKGALYIPFARFLSRQATREPFVPDLSYPGNIGEDAALIKWVNVTLGRLKPGQKPTPQTN